MLDARSWYEGDAIIARIFRPPTDEISRIFDDPLPANGIILEGRVQAGAEDSVVAITERDRMRRRSVPIENG